MAGYLKIDHVEKSFERNGVTSERCSRTFRWRSRKAR